MWIVFFVGVEPFAALFWALGIVLLLANIWGEIFKLFMGLKSWVELTPRGSWGGSKKDLIM